MPSVLADCDHAGLFERYAKAEGGGGRWPVRQARKEAGGTPGGSDVCRWIDRQCQNAKFPVSESNGIRIGCTTTDSTFSPGRTYTDCTYEFGPALNVLLGANGNGYPVFD